MVNTADSIREGEGQGGGDEQGESQISSYFLLAAIYEKSPFSWIIH